MRFHSISLYIEIGSAIIAAYAWSTPELDSFFQEIKDKYDIVLPPKSSKLEFKSSYTFDAHVRIFFQTCNANYTLRMYILHSLNFNLQLVSDLTRMRYLPEAHTMRKTTDGCIQNGKACIPFYLAGNNSTHKCLMFKNLPQPKLCNLFSICENLSKSCFYK